MAGTIRDKTAVVGAGCCKFGENWDRSREDMIVDAVYEAYEDAGIEDPDKQIEAVFCGAVYPREGSWEIAEALKLFGKPISMISDYCHTGTDAFRYGVYSVASGMYDTVLVVGFDKPKDRGVSGPSVSFDRVRGLPATPAGWFSLCAARYFETFDTGREDLAKIAVKNHHNGTLAPKSMLKREISVDDVLSARIISWPFGLYDCAAQSDGAAAAIITRADLAKSFRDDYVLVKAVTIAVGPHPQRDPEFDFLRWKPTEYAATEAYRQALLHPDRAVDLRGSGTVQEGRGQGARPRRNLRARRRAAREHRRRPEDLRPSDGRDGRAHDLRERQAAAGQGRQAPGARRDHRAQPQHRRPADDVRDRHPRHALSHAWTGHSSGWPTSTSRRSSVRSVASYASLRRRRSCRTSRSTSARKSTRPS
jgi:acetyl-CoA C-acetyltransferase